MQYCYDASSIINESMIIDAESTNLSSSIFQKYKRGSALPNAPFKLV
jgi:hypothetical protein